MRNSLLAAELGKLPELQDGISDEETFTLSRILEFYKRENKARYLMLYMEKL